MMQDRSRRVVWGALAAAGVWLLLPAAAGAHGKAGLTDQVLEVVLTEWSLGFKEVEAAGELTVHVVNAGTTKHDLTVEVKVRGKEYEFKTALLDPKGEAVFRLDLPPGEYELYCSVEGHKEAGLVAELKIKEKETAAPKPAPRGGYY